MDASMWDSLPGTDDSALSAEGAKSKRPDAQDAPSQQPMRAGLKPAQRRQPTGDQKKVRRQMARQASAPMPSGYEDQPLTVIDGDGEEWTRVTEESDNLWVHSYVPTAEIGHSPLMLTLSQIQQQYGLASKTSSITTTKESTMNQSTESDLLARLAGARTLSEQTALQSQIEALRSNRREHTASSESLDWDGLGELPPTRMQAAASLAMSGHLPPMTASTRLGHTEATDWMDDLTPSHTVDAVLSATARADATQWYESVWSPVKADRQEFSAQAHNAAVRSGIAFGLQSTAAASVFIEQVRHLASRDGITLIAGAYAGGSPTHGDSAKCHKDGKSIEFFDGQWMHLNSDPAPSHNDVHPGTPKEIADGTAMGSRTALETTVDTYVSDGKTTQPVGVSPSHAQDTMDEWGIGSDANGKGDPKSTSTAGDAPSLKEGDTPETGSGESLDNPNYGVGPDKSEWAVGNTDDKMTTQGSRKVISADWNGQITPQAFCSELRKYDDLWSTGGREHTSSCPVHGGPNANVAYMEWKERVSKSASRTASLASRMASEFGSTMGRGIQTYAQEEQSTSADGLSSARAPEDAPSMQYGDEPESGHAESPTQNNGEGAKDMSSATAPDALAGGVNWNGNTAARHSLAQIGASFRGKQVSPEIATFGQALERFSSIDDSLGGISARKVVSLLLASPQVPSNVKSALLAHRTAAMTCSVCGDAIAKDGEGEDNSTYHHDNGEKHDHEAKPGGGDSESKESSRRTAATYTCVHCGNTIVAKADPTGQRVAPAWTDAPDETNPINDMGFQCGLNTGSGMHEPAADWHEGSKEGSRAPFGREAAADWSVGDRLTRDGKTYEITRVTPAGSAATSHADGPTYHAQIVQEDGSVKPGQGVTLDIWSGSMSNPTSAFSKTSAKMAAAPLTTCQRAGCGATITEWKGVNDRYGHGTAYVCAEGHTNYVSGGSTPYGGTSLGSVQAAKSDECPKCGEHMTDVTTNKENTTLTAKCDACGWSGSKKKSAKQAASDTGTCGECGRAISYDSSNREWTHDNEGSDTGHPAKKASLHTAGTKAEPNPESIKDVGNGRLGERGTCKNCGKGVSKGVAQRTSGWVHSSGSKWCPEDFGNKTSGLLGRIAAGLHRVAAASWIDAARASAEGKSFLMVDTNGQSVPIKWSGDDKVSGGILLDMTTAHMLVQIHDALGSEKAAEFAAMPIQRAVDIGWKLVNKTSARTAGGDFSISDAKNDEGEWIMSPEEIRAEMGASNDPEDEGDWYRDASRKTAIEDAGLGVGHIWTNTSCPAYTSLNGADCTCDNKSKSASRKTAEQVIPAGTEVTMPGGGVWRSLGKPASTWSGYGYDEGTLFEAIGLGADGQVQRAITHKDMEIMGITVGASRTAAQSSNCTNGNHSSCTGSSCTCKCHKASKSDYSGACGDGDHAECKMTHGATKATMGSGDCLCPDSSHKTTASRRTASGSTYQVKKVHTDTWIDSGETTDAAGEVIKANVTGDEEEFWLMRNNFNGAVNVYAYHGAMARIDRSQPARNMGSYQQFYGQPYSGI